MGNFKDAKQPQTLNKIPPQEKDFHRAIICVWSENLLRFHNILLLQSNEKRANL